jgi:gliding motility-associated-like protein
VKKTFLFIGFLFASIVALAQYISAKGNFQVDQIRGCAPLTVNILTTNLQGNGCTGTNGCIMSLDGPVKNNCAPNSDCSNLTQLVYPTPGTYQLSILLPVTGWDTITITVDPNTPPPFEIFSCAGSKVSIDITTNIYDSYAIDFNDDGTTDTTIPAGNNQVANFSYGATGNYNISVKGMRLNSANNCNANVQSLTALVGLPAPSINTLVAQNTSALHLEFTPQTNIEYHAEIAFNNSSNFQIYQTLYEIDSLTIRGLAVDKNYYCLRLSSYDPCSGGNTYSTPVCSQEFSMTPANGVDQLTWLTPSVGISDIAINRNGSLLATVPATTATYNDNAIICKTNYCYQLVSKYAGGATSTSLQKCGTSFLIDTPTPIMNTSAVIANDNAEADLVWLQDPAFTTPGYNVSRATSATGSFVLENTTTTTKYTDATYAEGYCYKVSYVDNCGNASTQGLVSCPIQLKGAVDDTNDVNLQWTGYKGWTMGVKNYTVQKYNAQGQLLQTINAGSDSTYTDSQQDAVNQVLLYKITATANEAGVSGSVSNEIKVVKGVGLFYPTAFNPDSKVAQVNRSFTVKGHFIASMELQIFDRWGSLVFISEKNEAWDGKRDGSNMPDATYVWTAQGTDLNGSSFKKAGTIVLIRK